MSVGWFRKAVQGIRHAPGLRRLSPLWNGLRPLYRWVLRNAGRHGVPVGIGGYQFRVHPNYAQTSFETLEPRSYALLPEHLRSGDVFVDVGTAIGSYTLVAGRIVGPTGRVISYEADPAARRYLEQHLAWNGQVDRTTVRPVCCGRTNGEVAFHTSPTDVGGEASLFPRPGYVTITVPCVTLDADLGSLGVVPRLIKIDVEGAEWDVLHGAEEMLRTHRPFLLVSLHPPQLENQGISEQAVLEWLSARGYELVVVERDYEVHVFATPKSADL